jgi:hypothetical protein
MIDSFVLEPIGGENSIVEIDECQIGRRKYHRGRLANEVWGYLAVSLGTRPRETLNKYFLRLFQIEPDKLYFRFSELELDLEHR